MFQDADSKNFVDRVHSRVFFRGENHPDKPTTLEIADIEFGADAFMDGDNETFVLSTAEWSIRWQRIWQDGKWVVDTEFQLFGDTTKMTRDLIKVKMFTCL